MQQSEVAMFGVYAGAPELDDLRAVAFVRPETEFALAIIADVRSRNVASLQPVRSDNLAVRHVLDDQMITDLIERIDIEPGDVRFGQAFVQLEVENLKP